MAPGTATGEIGLISIDTVDLWPGHDPSRRSSRAERAAWSSPRTSTTSCLAEEDRAFALPTRGADLSLVDGTPGPVGGESHGLTASGEDLRLRI